MLHSWGSADQSLELSELIELYSLPASFMSLIEDKYIQTHLPRKTSIYVKRENTRMNLFMQWLSCIFPVIIYTCFYVVEFIRLNPLIMWNRWKWNHSTLSPFVVTWNSLRGDRERSNYLLGVNHVNWFGPGRKRICEGLAQSPSLPVFLNL